MHVRTRKLAFAGLMLAVTIVCLYLGNIIESNTLFLLAGASYFVGIVYREAGAKMSLAFYVGALILGFLVTPNKFYILTYAAMGLYILFNEWAYFKIRKKENIRRQSVAFWIVKYLVFNVCIFRGSVFFRNYYLQERFRYGCLRVLWQQDRLRFSCMTELMNMYRAACGTR